MTFADWYKTYPRKMKPRDAEKAWREAMNRGVTPEQIDACTKIMVATEWRGRIAKHIPYPASFLRAETFSEYKPDNRESFELPLFAGNASVPEPELQECDYCLVMVPASEIRVIHGLKACLRDARLWESEAKAAVNRF